MSRLFRYNQKASTVMRKNEQSRGVLILVICISVSLLVSCKKNNSNTENAMPTAVISVDTTRGDITTVFHFDASKSTDKEDPVISLQTGWNFGDDGPAYSPFSTAKITTHTYTAPGVYFARLAVKDTQGLSDTTSKMIVIVHNLANLPPTKPVYTAPDNYSTFIPSSVKLTWLCTDPENDPLSYDIFLGYDPNILYRINTNITLNEYTLTSMDKGANYFWQIAAHDPNGNYVLGDVWKFTTAP